ncbi:hypothetical protein M2163_001690 [Streptomyces sp. SAI-135]|uniref:hypothetical protein n=1 Tax=unclassified Streptomyces TaxID=2593676 RepID=UPI00247444A4|nr:MULTISPECIES: hypothetical protein [unclassified Streptomyces]MDH6521322.1 hypothetical protein [Streptomyces sp. SAI-090]MDH6553545.1 hypothetical protein [Streptomyces sp. SAI-041]MDH6572627.1 hypothetical protein [Streptomyces sp. SAI-117]MDH6582413.1 hypothetical protein [Streptomyces sp. SAI-133]MDH6614582.1 hypothetical protein [Streptomyces sp. SAI-135]
MNTSRSTGSRWRTGALAVLLTAGALTVSSPTAQAESARTETAVGTSGGVTETLVRVRAPLPASFGARPAACDWLSYLRYRSADGPAAAADADRVLIAQPGILEGAGAFDSVARNTVARAARQGRHIEFWALDRRSNCLEDRTGIASGDQHTAVDYYYRGKQVQGRTFAGFVGNDKLGWMAKLGIEQTVRDEYDLLTAELPDPGVRRTKVLCGGHSLGGVVTGYFATADFDGDRATTADAGQNQCAGWFALDTTVSTSLGDLSGSIPDDTDLPDVGLGYGVVQAGLDSGVLPRSLSAPVLLNPETMTLLAIAGVGALQDPGGEADLPGYLPANANIEATNRFLFSKDTATFLTGSPAVKDFRLTNQAVLGALMDDQSVPLAFLQSSVGFFDGGPVTDKNFPAANGSSAQPGLFGTEYKAIPAVPHGPLYTWRTFDRVGDPDDPGHRSSDGTPFTAAGKEVTDIQELARSMAAQPLDFTEQYFPTKLVTDLELSTSPQVKKLVVHPDGLTANPTLTVLAGDGLLAGRVPADLHPVVADGYQHLDVLTAAPVQNNGRPEPVSTALTEFARSPR